MSDSREASIIRQHSQEMALRAIAIAGGPEDSLTLADYQQLIHEWTDWFQVDAAPPPAASTPQSTPRRSESAGNGQGGGRTGFASPKQENWFKDLLSKAGASDEDVRTVLAHLSATSHGGRGGAISTAIDDLRGDGKGGAAAMLVQAAEDWKERANATPGDTTGLPELQS